MHQYLPASRQDGTGDFVARDLEVLFDRTFMVRWQTRLRGGAEEPLYRPAGQGIPAEIRYTRDYFRSALHEVAHWCIAGERRRRLQDFGYWYQPDGRDSVTQRRFLQVEEKPQALELLFCAAAGHAFSVSLDNLDGDSGDVGDFQRAVRGRALALLDSDRLPGRARLWMDCLASHYQRRVSRSQVESVFIAMT
jgi:elongation factor P hydroxylase